MPARMRAAAGRRITGAAMLLIALVIVAYAALIPAGQWQGDEYLNFALARQYGWAFLGQRLLSWSPRPFSELLIHLYAAAVNGLHRPLVAPALVAAWALLGAGLLIGLPPRGPAWRQRATVLLAFAALCLLLHPPGEMFYWPMGALAYLPSLGGLACATLLLVRGLDGARGRRLLCMAALLLAATSTELAAVCVLALGGLIALTTLPALWRGGARRGGWLARTAWWAVPLAAAAVVLARVAAGRIGAEPPLVAGLVAPGLWRSLRTGLAAYGDELAGRTIWPGSWVWLLVALLGMACCLRRAGVAGGAPGPLLAFAAAAPLAAVVSAASAVREFGTLCCQRHEAFRGGLTLLAVLAVAGLLAAPRAGIGARLWRLAPDALGPPLLAAAVLACGIARLPALLHDYRQMPARIAARNANWASGTSPGAAMTLRQTARPRIVNDGTLPGRGRYEPGADTPWFMQGVLLFFDKRALDVTPPP